MRNPAGYGTLEYIDYMYSRLLKGLAMPTTIRLKGDIEARIKRLAEQTGRPQSFYINQMIEREIDRIE